MTQRLEKAFEEASELPEAEQDNFAAFILEELVAERRWSVRSHTNARTHSEEVQRRHLC